MPVLPSVLAGLAAALVVAVGTRPLLRRLPEPPGPDPDLAGKIPYADLPTGRFVVVLTLLAGLLVAGAAALVPSPEAPAWFVLGTLGLVLAGIDARTTWLPLVLTRATSILTGVAVLVGAALLVGSGAADLILRAGLGALAGLLVFGVVWRLTSGGLGFGDVRYAPIVGAVAGTHSVTLVLWALVLGAVCGGLVGALRLVRGRREPFPYAPSLFAGAWLALAAASASGR